MADITIAIHIELDILLITTTYAVSTDSFKVAKGASASVVAERRWLEQSFAVDLLAIAIDRKTAALISFDSD